MAIVITAAGWVVIDASPAAAHASLESTSPAADQVVPRAPTEIVLHFDQGVDVSIGGVALYGPDGRQVTVVGAQRVDNGAGIRVPVTLTTRGTYTVSWRVVSEDGHAI